MSLIYPAQLTANYTELADELVEDDPFRSHLGASTLGRECGREVWYSWRWFTFVQHTGRMKRLFQRGHREEPIILASLAAAGISSRTIDDATGKQFRFIGYMGHEGGSGDGFLWNVPDIPVGQWALFEAKTHNAKSFAAVSKLNKEGYNVGLMEKKPEHYAQMQRYMKAWGLNWTVYCGVCKDNDERLWLIVPYEETHAQQVADRAVAIIHSDRPPAKLSETPTFYKCTYCDHKGTCHNGELPHKSCRSCVYSKPVDNGQWACTNPNHPCALPRELQLTGCANYQALV